MFFVSFIHFIYSLIKHSETVLYTIIFFYDLFVNAFYMHHGLLNRFFFFFETKALGTNFILKIQSHFSFPRYFTRNTLTFVNLQVFKSHHCFMEIHIHGKALENVAARPQSPPTVRKKAQR